jgi:ferritin-like metal-binding protein YciE
MRHLVDSASLLRAQVLLASSRSTPRTIIFTKEIPTMPSPDSLEELLHDELKDIYDAEKQLTKALPKLAKKASATELKNAFEEHLRQTERQVERLEQAFERLGMPARSKKCEGMRHLISEGEAMISEAEDDATRDAVMIASAQKVEHYEIATYGTLRTWATLLGKREVAALLEETLEEEKETDRTLTNIAESFVNEAAVEGDQKVAGGTDRKRASRAVSVRHARSTAADKGATRKRARSR